jgi:type IV secretory pathway TrbL component
MITQSIKSFLACLMVVFIFSYVSEGILLAFAMKKSRSANWIKIALITVLFVSCLAFILAPYHLYGQTEADGLFTLAFTLYGLVMAIGGGIRFLDTGRQTLDIRH